MEEANRSGSRIFKRLLVFNLITVLVVSLVPQFVFYRYFMTMYNEEAQALNMQTVRQFQSAIDEPIVKAMVNFPNQYLSELESNEALVYPLTRDISRDSAAILKVARRIDDIKNNTPFLHSIDLYYPKGNLLFLGDRVCMLNESECPLGGRADWFGAFAESDLNIDWIGARTAGPHDPSQIATYVRSIPFFGSKEVRQGTVAVNLDLAELDAKLRGLKAPASGMLLIVDEAGGVIAHNYGDEPLPDLSQDALRAKLLGSDGAGMFDAKVDGQASVVSFVSSAFNDWRYVSVTSIENAYRKSNQLRGWMLAIGSAFLAVNVLVSVWLTARAHKPISNRMENLRQSLIRHMPVVRHNYVLGLLFGSAPDAMKIGDMRSILGIGHEGRLAAAFALRIEREGGMEHEEALAADFHLIEHLESGVPGADIAAIRDDRSQILGFISYPEEVSLPAILAQVTEMIESTGERYTLCLGGSYPSNAGAVARSFSEADEALEYAFLHPEARILLHEELRVGALKEPGNLPKALDELPAAIKAGDGKRLQQLIGDLLAEIRQGEWTVKYCRNVLQDIVLAIDKTVQQLGFQPAELFGGDLREQYRDMERIDQFEAWIGEVAETAMSRIHERKGQFDLEFADKIVSYVNNSISHQLSLVSAAEHVGVSPTYLSKIFKSITGSNFNEYVTGLRLERAAELLRERKLSVQEISYRVGYQSTHHFIRLFKEKHGLTPKQYQKKIADGGEEEL